MQRLQGYKIAMSENGLNPDTNYIVYPKDYKKLCDSIISKNEPSAIVVAKSEYAHKIMTILHKSSIKIPEQISIIACNNMPYNDYLFPPLTSIQLPYREMGSKAVEILIESIENSSTGRNIKVPNKIIERQSCKELSVV